MYGSWKVILMIPLLPQVLVETFCDFQIRQYTLNSYKVLIFPEFIIPILMAARFDTVNLVVQPDRRFASVYHLSKCHLPHIQIFTQAVCTPS
jgi:hypothetical protein